ncbi:helix-turn-helix domain-containing protein [Paenibacillus lautus]|uniref:helix-turn-helix domain-containing protein n=1 Tax=Paenibacillus lautus TaxID=1401 RepID=UPI003342B978
MIQNKPLCKKYRGKLCIIQITIEINFNTLSSKVPREILSMHKLSEKDLARRTGIRQATINGVCNNEVTLLSLKNSAPICETLEIEISDFLKIRKLIKRDPDNYIKGPLYK